MALTTKQRAKKKGAADVAAAAVATVAAGGAAGIPSEPGVYPGVAFAAYLKIKATNWHKLEPFRKSAKEGRYRQLLPDEACDAQKLGEALHAALFEPERFDAEYATLPQFD